MEFLPLRMCTRDRISPPENAHKRHIKMTILSPFLSRIDEGANKNEGKKWKYEQG